MAADRHQRLHSLRGLVESRGRASLRTRKERLRMYGPPVLQVALAIGLAWELCVQLVDDPAPTYGAVTAAVSLGVTVGQRGRLAVEMVLGVALGIAFAGLAAGAVGTGVVQLVALSAGAMLLAVLLAGGPNLIVQAGVWAILVATFTGPGDIFPDRFFEALIGGVVALLFSQLLFPLDPVRTAERAAGLVLHELADHLSRAGQALRDCDEEEAARVRLGISGLERRIGELGEALAMSTGAARLAPARRRQRSTIERYRKAAPHIALMIQDAGSMTAAAARLVRDEVDVPDLAASFDDLGRSAVALADWLSGSGSERAVRALAGTAAGRLPDDAAASPTELVAWAQVQSVAHHLVVATGLTEQEARELLGTTLGDDAATVRRELMARLV